MITVFISYAHEDLDVAYNIFNTIKSRTTANPWLDKESLIPGQFWRQTIKKVIKNSNFFILILSRKSISKKGFFQNEIKIALDTLDETPIDQIYLIPIRIEDIDLPSERLKEIHYIDFFPKENEREAMEKVVQVINNASEYSDRIERAKKIINEIKTFTDESKSHNNEVMVRMRAAFTSMSNIRHYYNKNIPKLLPEQKKLLDDLLIEERDSINELLKLNNVKLKCLCWPKIKFVKKYYTVDEQQQRKKLLEDFLNNSIAEFADRRQIISDETGSLGNQLILGNKFAISANPESGGYTKSSFFTDYQTIDVLILEYDNLFSVVMKNRYKIKQNDFIVIQNKKMIKDTQSMLSREV